MAFLYQCCAGIVLREMYMQNQTDFETESVSFEVYLVFFVFWIVMIIGVVTCCCCLCQMCYDCFMFMSHTEERKNKEKGYINM